MFIYFLSVTRGVPYDSYGAHVVIAPDEAAARAMVPCAAECPTGRRNHAEGPCVWRDPARAPCEILGTALDGSVPVVVLSSFNAG